MSRKGLRSFSTLLLVGVVLASLIACAWPLGRLSGLRPPEIPTREAPPVQEATPQAAPGTLPPASVNAVVRQVMPAVVQIANEQVVADELDQPAAQQQGIGSGLIYDPRGYVLTNHHVVAGAQSLTVALPDGRRFEGTLVGGDRDTDLAVVRIQGDSLPVARLGSSGALQVGDWVVAIGNALGLPGGPTVTAGVVSALGRAVQEPPSGDTPGPYLYDLIQTDAAINPGNSGGPLVDLQGRVVGINTLVAGMAEAGYQAQGIGFAIGIDTAKPIADELVATGRVVHPYLGIYYVPLNPALAARLKVNAQRGVVVARVVRGTPAERAGLQERDVIVAVEDTELADESTLGRLLRGYKPGATLTLQVLRGNKTISVRVELGEKPPDL